MEKKINESSELHSAGKYKESMKASLIAIDMCQCGVVNNRRPRHEKDKSCHIQQCLKALLTHDPEVLAQVSRRPCACGYEWPRCTQALHATALYGLAGTQMTTGNYISAFSTALSIIRLDPSAAQGYVRAAEVLRELRKGLKAESSSLAMSARRAADEIVRMSGLSSNSETLPHLMTAFIKSGLHNVERYRRRDSDEYEDWLRRLGQRLGIVETRKDPVKTLPPEVIHIVFSFLSTSSLISCLRVSKLWYQTILQDKLLWTVIRLVHPRSTMKLRSFLKRLSHAKSLIILETDDFRLTPHKMGQIVNGLPRLQRLHLGSRKWENPPDVGNVFRGRTSANLTHISFHNIDLPVAGAELIQLCSNTLESLDVVSSHDFRFCLGSCSFPKLRRLRIISTRLLNFPLLSIIPRTPALEELYLDNFEPEWAPHTAHLHPNDLLHDFAANSLTKYAWHSLRRLVLGPRIIHRMSPGGVITASIEGRRFPPLPSTLQHIEILTDNVELSHNIFFARNTTDYPNLYPDPITDFPHLPHLQTFRCRSYIKPSLLKPLLEPAAQNGSLEVLELAIDPTFRFPSDPRIRHLLHNAEPIQHPATDLSFAQSENLHTLGLRDFNWADADSHGSVLASTFNGKPLLDWIECFPKLHTVMAYPGMYEQAAGFMLELIRHPSVKELHQSVLSGIMWDEAKKLAAEHGVKLHHTVNFVPAGWYEWYKEGWQ